MKTPIRPKPLRTALSRRLCSTRFPPEDNSGAGYPALGYL
jgi:hypothetical protein